MRTDIKSYSMVVPTVVILFFILTFSTNTAFGCGDPYLDVKTSTNWIPVSDDQNAMEGGNDNFDPAIIYITVYDSNGDTMPNTQVRVRAITVPGSGGHGGPKHFWEMGRDPELQTDSNGVTRPYATLEGLQGTHVISTYPDIVPSEDVTAITDSSGKVYVQYNPPFVTVKNTNKQEFKRVVAGTDTVTVSLVDYPEIKKVTQITVGYSDLIRFIPDENVTLDPQNNPQDPYDDNTHDDFYCTAETSKSIHNIANEYRAWFDEENNKKNDKDKKIFKPLRITAMSLKYGGLSDIKGDWKQDHITHSNGKCVDLGMRDIKQYKEKIIKIYNEDPNHKVDPENPQRKGYHDELNNCLHLNFNT